MSDNRFEVICLHKDQDACNLSEVFGSYGNDTLEARVPIASDPQIEKLASGTKDQQEFVGLKLQARSATDAMEGRLPRTRNRVLKLVEMGNRTILATGEERERSSVDIETLDEELESYMQVARRKNRVKVEEQPKQLDKPDEPSVKSELESDLDAYMREANRRREQKKRLAIQLDQAQIMNQMEEDFDNDTFYDN